MEIKIGLTQDQRAELSGKLSKLLADTYALYVKTQNVHWNVHGPEFYALHKLTEEQYEELADAIDIIAERIRALGFYVDGTMKSFLDLTSVEEEKGVNSREKYLEDLIHAHETVIRECREIGTLSDKHKDFATNDLMGKRLGDHEKALWMLRSQI